MEATDFLVQENDKNFVVCTDGKKVELPQGVIPRGKALKLSAKIILVDKDTTNAQEGESIRVSFRTKNYIPAVDKNGEEKDNTNRVFSKNPNTMLNVVLDSVEDENVLSILGSVEDEDGQNVLGGFRKVGVEEINKLLKPLFQFSTVSLLIIPLAAESTTWTGQEREGKEGYSYQVLDLKLGVGAAAAFAKGAAEYAKVVAARKEAAAKAEAALVSDVPETL